MAYCVKCGGRVEDTDKKCPFCGADIPVSGSRPQSQGQSSEYTYGQSSEYTYGQSSGYTYGKNNEYTYGQNDSDRSYHGQNGYSPYYDYEETAREGFFHEAEVRKNKVMGILCYLGVLVFVPILAGDKDSEYLKLHKNQGLVLFLINLVIDFLAKKWVRIGILGNFVGDVIYVGCDILSFVLAILWILGIIYACRGTKKELPGIGKIKIFK